jgi:DNA primase
VKNTVAVSGTALTKEQINILKRYTKNFKLCFDMDEAGQKAAAKSVQLCLMENLDAEIILLPKGFKDVNDLVIEDSKAWKKAIKNSEQVMDYFFSNITNKHDKKNPKGKKKIAHELLNIIKDISDPIEQSYWLRKLSEEINIKEDALTEFLEQVKLKENKIKKEEQFSPKDKKVKVGKPVVIQLQESLLGLIVMFSKDLKVEIDEFEVGLLDEKHQDILDKILSGKTEKIEDLIGRLEMQTKYTFNQDEIKEKELNFKKEWQDINKKLQIIKKEEQLGNIIKDIKTAENQEDEESLDLLMEEFSKISKKLEELKK